MQKCLIRGVAQIARHLNLCQGVPERSDVQMASPAGVLCVPFVWRIHGAKELRLLSATIIITVPNL